MNRIFILLVKSMVLLAVLIFIYSCKGLIEKDLGRATNPQKWMKIIQDSAYQYNGLRPACSNSPLSTSDEFFFYIKTGTVNNLVIFFDGGGACWSSINCIYCITYHQELSSATDNPIHHKGILDTNHPNNPFKDWNFVFIPYCTGDVHWGATDTEYIDYLGLYGPVGSTITIKHRGFVNFNAVLEWISTYFVNPQKILVSGSSAGSYGAILAFPYIKKKFPESEAYVLSDAGNGVMDEGFRAFFINNWNIQLPDWIFDPGLTLHQMGFEGIYKKIVTHYPNCRFAQFTNAGDTGQIWYYNAMLAITADSRISPSECDRWDKISTDTSCDWYKQTLDFCHFLSKFSNYRYYIASGDHHTILLKDRFYVESVKNVSFVEWIHAMIQDSNGGDDTLWNNYECTNCNLSFTCNY